MNLPRPELIDRLPPHNIEAEQSVLGAILLDAQAAMPEAVEILGANGEAFYDLRHGVIYQACASLWSENKPIHLVTISEALRQANQLEAVGGLNYLAALPEAAPAGSGVSYFAEIVEDKATLRRTIQACHNIISKIYDGGEAESLLANAEREVLAIRRMRRETTPCVRELVHSAIAEIERLHATGGALSGIPTGYPDLDRATDGLHAGEMIILAAFPGTGKTALALNIAEHVALTKGIPVGIFSLEMKAMRLVLRMMASNGRLNIRNIKDGFMAERDFPKLTSASGKIAKAPIHICDASDMSVFELRAKARQMQQKHGIKFFIVDYLQLLTAPGKREQNREQEVAAISRNIKNAAGELEAPFLALSQLNDDGKLRESRAIGQDADSVWVLRNETKTNERGETVIQTGDTIPVVLEIRKQRDGEAPASIPLTFLRSMTRFESAAKSCDTHDFPA